MNSFRNNPDGEENQRATIATALYVGGLQLQQAAIRQYVPHRWMSEGNGAVCIVCGITERVWDKRVANAPTIDWDCKAVRDKDAK